jgi:hypothetical protein
MIEEILKILNSKYDNNISYKLKNGDYDIYYNNNLTSISFSNGKLGSIETVIYIIERELDYFLSHKKVKITTEDNNGTQEISHGSKNRKRRRNRKCF